MRLDREKKPGAEPHVRRANLRVMHALTGAGKGPVQGPSSEVVAPPEEPSRGGMIPRGSYMACGNCGATFAVSQCELPEDFMIRSRDWRMPNGAEFVGGSLIVCHVCKSRRIDKLVRVDVDSGPR